MGTYRHKNLDGDAVTPRTRHWLEDKPALNYMYEFPNGIEGICRTLMMGEGKYTRGEWKDDLKDRYKKFGIIDSLNRHLMSSMNGEKVDPESGLDHLYHVAVNALMLAEKYAEQPTKKDKIQYPFPVDSDVDD